MSERISIRSRVASAAHRIIRRPRPSATPSSHAPVPLSERRRAMEGYVVCFELGEATVVAEGGAFAFQVPEHELRLGQQVRFVRRGDRFELV